MTTPSVFISYSHKDEIWKDRLRPHLGMLERDGRLKIWDDRSIDGGETWYPEIQKAMADAEIAVCLISADYLNSSFCVKEEIPYLLKRRESEGMLLLPVLIRPCLWDVIEWLKAIQMLPRDGKAVAKDFKEDWDTPFAEVARRVNSFLKTPKREVITPPLALKWTPPVKVDVDRLPVTGADLFGRQKELKMLDEAWESGTLNVVSLVAWGGVGKSTLVNKWREQMATDSYRGAKRVYAWSFYSQGTGDTVSSADIFIAEALKWFGDPETANSNASPWDKGQKLAELVRQEKTLLLLDGMEPLQSYLDVERGRIKDPALETLVIELARENPGLCVITTRENVANLSDFPKTTHQIDLEQISAEAGRALLRVGGVQGTDAELEQASRDFGLHALALNLLAAYLHDIPGHHISHAAEIPDLDVSLEKGRHPRRVMAAFAKRFGDSAEVEILHTLGLFNSPANKEEIAALRASPPIPGLTEHLEKMTDAEWLRVIHRLRRMKLLVPESSHRPDALDCHPLLREHFGKQLKETNPAAWREGNNRLYKYYKTSAKEYPDTLEEMAPLFAAVMHGCQAGKYQEAFLDYYQRIQRGGDVNYCCSQLGAFGADLAVLSSFFNSTWHKLVHELREDHKGFLLNEAGFDLRALGRLTEAALSMQASLDVMLTLKDWEEALIRANNLSELYLTMGNVTQGLAYAEQSTQLADQSGNANWIMVSRTKIATALHQAGRFTESEIGFREAENIHKKNQPEFPLLYSFRGYQYCDLLLSQGNYEEVEWRASQILGWVTQASGVRLLDTALTYLSLGYAYLRNPQHKSKHSLNTSLTYLNRAVNGLRQAGDQTHVPQGLLVRAEYYRAVGELDKSQRDLDEALAIASRGGMGLHLADCHLGYARLSLAHGRGDPAGRPYTDEAREHLRIAKEMIDKMGYHRRDKEVEELEELLSAGD